MPHKYHAFVCCMSRPEGHPLGSCSNRGGGQDLLNHLRQRFQEDMLWKLGVAVSQSSCLGFCGHGPLMVVYPEDTWYRPTTTADIDEIVQSHFVEGKVVQRLVVTPGKKN